MKHLLLIFSFIIIFSSFVHGQDNRLIYPKQVSNTTEKSNEILQRSDAFVSVEFVEIDLEKILEFEQLILQFGKNNILINKERINVRGINSFCFMGSNIKHNSILISVLDSDIQGVIETDNGIYAIETIGKNNYAIIEVDQSKLNDCGGVLSEIDDELDDEMDYEEEDRSNTDHNDIDGDLDYDNGSISPILQSVITRDCKIRILVLYTPYAQTRVSNIKNTILTAIELSNQSFIKSSIYYRVELAYAGLTNYSESANTTADFRRSLRRFRNDGDGYMDEVHTLRDRYSADICVLLLGNNDLCGLATGIMVNANRAFCAVSTYGTCATTNHSFIHEIGHLLGCRHDMKADANIVPLDYAHGYINPSKTWRTIMAYASSCNDCRRIGYWSNPNVYYNGEVMGTTKRENNARVWNVYSEDYMAYRQPYSNIIFTNSDFSNGVYGDVVAKQNITTSGTINVTSGNTLHMSAGNSIRLLPGFSAQAGSEFSAKIENIVDCGSKENAPKILVENMPNEDEEMIESIGIDNRVFGFSYKVFPNPSNELINIQYFLNTEVTLSIELVNFLGQRVKTILPKQNQQAGSYELQIPVSEFATGTYFLTISSANQTKIEKIIINQ